jgi:nitrogen fixation NifU-like protein
MTPEEKQAWSGVIVDHSQFPRRHGRLEHATHAGVGENPFCGDRVSLQLLVNEQGEITDARFEATGCAISTASASLLASHVVGRSLAGAEALFTEVHAMLTQAAGPPDSGTEELAALKVVRQYPARVKCATLAWHVLRHALHGEEAIATTE